MMNTPRALRISSAGGVNGALAPSAMILARIRARVFLGDDGTGGGGNQHVALGLQHGLARHVLAAGKALNLPSACTCSASADDVQPIVAVRSAGYVGDGDDRHAMRGSGFGGDRADVAEALHRHAELGHREVQSLARGGDRGHDAVPGGLAATDDAAETRPACR